MGDAGRWKKHIEENGFVLLPAVFDDSQVANILGALGNS